MSIHKMFSWRRKKTIMWIPNLWFLSPAMSYLKFSAIQLLLVLRPTLVTQIRSHGFDSRWVRQHSFVEIDLSLSRIPRDSKKYFEISVSRHIRFAGLRKK